MKSSELQAGKTYVGRGGKRRYISRRSVSNVLPSWDRITYDIPEGGIDCCSARAFARWAIREAVPEEQAP